MSMLAPNETRDYAFAAPLPPGQAQGLGIACVDFSDDNITNNCKTLIVNQTPVSSTAALDAANMSPDQIWQAIQEILRQQGVDLTDYNLVSIEGQLTPDQLKTLLNDIRSGAANVSVTGGSGSSVVAISSAPASTPKPTTPTAVAAEFEEAVPLGTEWSGLAPPLGSRPTGQYVTDQKTWKKLWRAVRSGRAPKVDFAQDAVAGVFAGRGEKADHAQIDSVEMSLAGLEVRYRLVHYATFNPDASRTRASVPYLMRVIPRTSVPVRFEKVEEAEDVPVKPKKAEKKP
jgi:hypothetical protein